MNNLIDIYTRLKLGVGREIVAIYYTKDGARHTEETSLLDTIYFSHIWIGRGKNERTSLPFFNQEVIIESITFKRDSQPTYSNSYLKGCEFENPFACYNQLEDQMQQVIYCNKDSLEERKELIKRYLKKDDYVKYEELFFSAKQKEEFEAFFSVLVKELEKYALSRGFDEKLKHIFTGTTSIIYEVGDKIVKIRKPRRMETIPYCEYILQPILNRTLAFDGYPIHIEVTQKVLTLDQLYGCSYDDVEKREEYVSILSTLVANLDAIGLCFTDYGPGNIGILLEDNQIHYDEIAFATADDRVTSIENNNHFKILPKGMPVIIDLDCVEIKDKKKYAKYLKSLSSKQGKKKK